jgi:hypothetical protein
MSKAAKRRRYSVFLDEPTIAALHHRSATTHIPVAVLIRLALAEYLGLLRRTARRTRKAGPR